MGFNVAGAEYAVQNIQHPTTGAFAAAAALMKNPDVAHNAGNLVENYASRNVANETPTETLNLPTISAKLSKDNSIA